MSPDSVRLFVAAAIPALHLAWVAERTEPLRQLWSDARWIPVENQHVTLKFLGSTSIELVDQVRGVCRDAGACVDAAEIELGGLGAFPSVRRARVLWVGLRDPSEALARLATALERGLEPLGFSPEKRPFSPHVTIARFKRPRALEAVPELESGPGPFALETFGLWRSHLSPTGARYELVEAFPVAFRHSA